MISFAQLMATALNYIAGPVVLDADPRRFKDSRGRHRTTKNTRPSKTATIRGIKHPQRVLGTAGRQYVLKGHRP